jgi:hypothetical protein
VKPAPDKGALGGKKMNQVQKKPQIFDDRLICREFYNPGKYAVELTRMTEKDEYILRSGISVGPMKIILQPDHFCFVAHSFYTAKCLGGSPTVELLQNFGKAMGIGNKLPSAPIPELASEKA